MDFNQFKNKWLGHVIDYDHVFKYQCVDLILQYIYECYGVNGGVWGNAIDYWVKTGNNGFNQNLLNKFDKIPTNEAHQGDIVVLNGLPGNPDGHIGIATGNIDSISVEILEQNGATGSGDGQGGNAIRVRHIGRDRIAGLLRPKVPVSTPAQTPVVPSGDHVFLPASISSWAIYTVGSQLRKGTADQVGTLSPARFGGLTYKIQSWIGNYAVVINTQDFGQVALWVKDTVAQFTSSAPAAPAPPVVVHPYTIESIAEKSVKINKNTHKWGLNYDNFTAIANNPESDANAGDIKQVRAVLHHNIGYNYFLENPDVASGYNVMDCDDYTAPPPAPVPNPTPPAAPLTLPSSETYDLIKDLDGYITSNQAVNRVTPKVKIPAGTYFVFNKRFANNDGKDKLLAVNLTKTPGKPGAWVNTLDNTTAVAAPVIPAPDKPTPEPEVAVPTLPPGVTYKAFPKSQKYVVTADVSVFDLSSGDVIAVYHKFDEVWIEGSAKKDGATFARLESEDQNEWLAIRVYAETTNLPNLELYNKVYDKATTVNDRQVAKTIGLLDRAALAWMHSRKIILGFWTLFSKIRPDTTKK
jgi:hypothetical protein